MRSRIQRFSSADNAGVDCVPSNFFWIQRFSLVSEMYMYSTPIVPQ